MITSAASEMTNEDMLFNMGGEHMSRDQYQNNILGWVQANKIGITEIDCDEFIFKKILVGDKSDNIPSVVTWQKEMKSGKLRTYSITDKMADTIYTQFIKEFDNFTIDYLFNSEYKDKLADVVYRVVGHSNIGLIKIAIQNNISLMLLHVKTIPDPIQKAIYESIERDWEGALDNIDNVMDMEKILKGTAWLNKEASFGPDAFAGMDIPSEENKSPIKLVGKKTKTEEKPKSKKLF
jgi:hypothetical protein